MPARATSCPQTPRTRSFAADELPLDDQPAVEEHLTQCTACRAVFRQHIGERYPRFSNYTITREIGRGGFGVVYKAVHHGKQRVEALKVLFGRTAQSEAYFANEVRLVANLRHPNIATLYEAHLKHAPRYYSMEFVHGETLDVYVRKHDPPLEARLTLFKKIADAVGYAHRQGVVHRDLKPQNILIDADGEPHILDFGIAKQIGHEAPVPGGGHEGALGTFGYMAPEQCAGQPVDARADVYSLGALLFHMLTGQPARLAPEPARLADLLRERQVSRPRELGAIIARCVETVPERRYPGSDALIEDVDRYLIGRAVVAYAAPPPGYRAARVLALVVRNHHAAVQTASVMVVAGLLAWLSWTAGAHRAAAAAPANASASGLALISVTPETYQAALTGALTEGMPGFAPANRKSWRLVFGRMLERLAVAEPRAVVFDYYFPDCQPAFDGALVDGIRAVGAPVVVAAQTADENAEPLLCPDVRAVAHGWGTLFANDPTAYREHLVLPLAIERGFNPPMPALALAGFAAARQPAWAAEYHVHPEEIEVRYRARDAGGGGSRYLRVVDRVPIFERVDPQGAALGLQAGDIAAHARFDLTPAAAWGPSAIGLERVLHADDAALRSWFSGRVVLVGQMLPPADMYRLQNGDVVFGCQLQALVLDGLLRSALDARITRQELLAWVGLACVAALLLALLLPLPDAWAGRTLVVAGVVLLPCGFVLALWASITGATDPRPLIAAAAVLSVGGPALAIRALHWRQVRLTRASGWSTDEATTLSTTVMATTRATRPSAATVKTGSTGSA